MELPIFTHGSARTWDEHRRSSPFICVPSTNVNRSAVYRLILSGFLALTVLGCSGVELTGDLEPAFGDAPTPVAETQRPSSLSQPLEIEGWRAVGIRQLYTPSNLFEAIDGEAELFLSYGFVGMSSQHYQSDSGGEIRVDVYDMGRPENAFGVYSTHRHREATFVQVGQQGMLAEGALDFWKGRYYFRTLDYEPTTASSSRLFDLGRAIAAQVTDATTEAAILQALPPGYIPNTGRYVREEMLGHRFLENGVIADYPFGGQVFVATFPRQVDAMRAFTAYENALRSENVRVMETLLPDLAHQAFVGEDAFYGTMAILQVEEHLAGILEAPDASFIQGMVPQLISGLTD